MKNIAIFASGSGTNAENLIRFFRTSPFGKVQIVLTNRPDAGVVRRAQSLDTEVYVFSRDQFYGSDYVLDRLVERSIDFIVLAGFLWLVPGNILKSFENKVVNIHPALLPKYGGKGMYGDHVHQAVIAAGDQESGISIHYVNRDYDEGDIIFQARCKVDSGDTPAGLAAKIHELEYAHFPAVVEGLLKEL
ncbi:MAG: phosphoribosylglycinamide formyltransferase [Bacteroidales bacterium]|nr:phosphoribosylglycinamide formyltransferase [Bacteroidales bacterium]